MEGEEIMKRKLKKISLLLLVITVFFASTNICSYALNEEILLHVNFDKNVQDLSGNENDGSVKGEVEYVDGIILDSIIMILQFLFGIKVIMVLVLVGH